MNALKNVDFHANRGAENESVKSSIKARCLLLETTNGELPRWLTFIMFFVGCKVNRNSLCNTKEERWGCY